MDLGRDCGAVLAATAVSQSVTDPLSGLVLGDVADPQPKPGWAVVRVVSSSLNMHDLWTLRGIGHPAENLPIVLGCDAAGYDEDGNAVMIYPVIADHDAGGGDETLDPNRALLSERHDGVRRVSDGAAAKPRSETCVVVVRRGGVPAGGVDDGLPNAVHPGRDQGR